MTDENLMADDSVEAQIDDTKNYYEELVGPDKKFKTNEDLAKSKARSDNYVKILEQRLDAMREDYTKARDENVAGPKMQDLLDQMADLRDQLASRNEPQKSNEDNKASYDPKEVESLVSNTIQKHEDARRERDNYNLVKDKLTERFGESFKSVLKKQASELQLTDQEVDQMARKNPSLFMRTFGLDVEPARENFSTPPRSNVRSDSFAPKKSGNRTMSYYEELRRKDPMAWKNPKIAIQMEKDAQALGWEAFNDV